MFQIESKNSELFQNNLFESSDFIDYQRLDESSSISWDDIMNPNCFPSFNNTIFESYKNELNYSKKTHKEIEFDNNIKNIKLTQFDSLEVEVCSLEENLNSNSFYQDKRDLKENLTSPFTLISGNLNECKDNSKDLAKIVEEAIKLGRNSNLPIGNSFENLKEIADRASLKSPQKQQRFGRAEDRELFFKLKQLCKEKSRQISDFWSSSTKIDSCLNEILHEVHLHTNYKGDKALLLKRIRKLGCTQDFSVREKKLLRDLLSVQLEVGDINLEKIEYFFPGKLSDVTRKEIGKVLVDI